MADEQTAELMKVLGISETEAQALIAAAGDDIEVSMAAAASSSAAAAAPPPARSGGFEPPFDWWKLVWRANEPVPPSWGDQALEFSDTPGARFGLRQRRNGPCGVLCVLQAFIISELRADAARRGAEAVDLDAPPTDDALARALTRMLRRPAEATAAELRQPPRAVLCTFADAGRAAIREQVVVVEELEAAVRENLAAYKAPGFLSLIVYSAVLTRGVDRVKADVSQDGGEPPLVVGPNNLCTSEVIGLLLTGKAVGNTSSYTIDGAKQDWDTPFGLLSSQELTTSVPVADSLKTPPEPIWILHGGDHFTTLFHAATAPLDDSPGATFTLHHYNGLAPGGPRAAALRVTSQGPRAPAPAKHRGTFRKTPKGCLDDIIQAAEADKKEKPHRWTEWSFELSLAVDDPSVAGAEADEGGEAAGGPPPRDYRADGPPEAGKKWRCATCYSKRFQTFCFGLNDGSRSECEHCGLPKEEALWSVWLRYDELPEAFQEQAMRMFAPKIHVVLSTKWKNVALCYDGHYPSA